nr:MAG TPA: hypothetical protein [Caudoviricetes sp.]
MDRLLFIEYTDSYGGSHSEIFYKVYDENFTPIRTVSAPKAFYAITNDGLYALADGASSLYALTIDYNGNKDISATKICDTNIGVSKYDGSNYFFSQDNKYLIVYGTVMWVFAVDLEKQTFTKIYESTYEDSTIVPLSNYKSFITKSGSQNYLIETIPDGKTIIGVRYQGETFYRYITHPGRFSAQQSDVRVGKTFIGYSGIPQTGTAEDLEVTQ